MTKKWLFCHSEESFLLLKGLSMLIARHLCNQIKAGAQVFYDFIVIVDAINLYNH